jgi:hypothetical protein
MVGWGLAVYVASPLLRSKGGTFEALTAAGGLLGCGSGVGLHRQAEGMKSDGLGAHRYRSRWGAVLYAAT